MNFLKEVFEATSRQLKKFRRNFYQHPYFKSLGPKELRVRWTWKRIRQEKQLLKSLFWSGWIRFSGHEKTVGKDAFFWPFYSNPRYNREVSKFMFSFRSEDSSNRNINNLMIITGPESAGKSWMLKHNLEKFRKTTPNNISPFCIYMDLKACNSWSFDTFLDNYENMFIDYLSQRSPEVFKNQQVLTPNAIFDVFFFNHDKLYHELKLYEILQQSVKGEGLLWIDEERKETIRNMLGKWVSRKYKETPLFDSFYELCKTLAPQYKDLENQHSREVKSAFNIFRALLINEEQNEAPPAYEDSLYRTGLKVHDFLLDIMNIIGGYHHMSTNEGNIEFPHALVVLENLHSLTNLETCEERAKSYFEHLAVRLYNEEGWRDHIPVIVEANDNVFYNTLLFYDLQIFESSFTSIEWHGVEQTEDFNNWLQHIFNQKHNEAIANSIGGHIHHIRIFTETVINSKEKEPDFLELLKCKGKEWDEEYNKMLNKINKTYLREEVSHLVEKNTIDYAVLNTLENFIWAKEIRTPEAIGEEIKNTSIIRAMLRVGLLYDEKHHEYMSPSSHLYVNFFKRYKAGIRKNMSIFEKLDYSMWRVFNGFHWAGLRIKGHREFHQRPESMKNNLDWDEDLYSWGLGKREDPKKRGRYRLMDGKVNDMPAHYAPRGRWVFILSPRVWLLGPFLLFAHGVMQYPYKWLHQPYQHMKEGSTDISPIMRWLKWLHRRRIVPSILPTYNAEFYAGQFRDEYEKALMKIAYMDNNPQMALRYIKWRYVRKWAKLMNDKSKNKK